MAGQFKFKLNRYNWLIQKLLCQHRYDDIIQLYNQINNSNSLNSREILSRRPASEQLNYIYSLALMRTSSSRELDKVIDLLQKLNYDKNSQYFLSLCQCLLYLGNFDSVVALCKQVINREIDSYKTTNSTTEFGIISSKSFQQERESEHDEKEDKQTSERLLSIDDEGYDNDNNINLEDVDKKYKLYSSFMSNETADFKKIFANINQNSLINEPKLWFTFGLCLEFKGHYKDATLAFKVASKLSAGNSIDAFESNPLQSGQAGQQANEQFSNFHRLPVTHNYYLPHMKYAEACIKYDNDFKTATNVMAISSLICPQNYTFTPMLALLISVHNQNFTSSNQNTSKAAKMISKLESYSASNRNPALGYNNLALRCKERLRQQIENTNNFDDNLSYATNSLAIGGEAGRVDLNFQLAKAHITINQLVQEYYSKIPISTSNQQTGDRYQCELSINIDKLIKSIANSDSCVWSSASLWNNLGVCFLINKRFIACLSCLIKAQTLNLFDWRINYNLAIACLQVNLVTKALNCLILAKNLHKLSNLNSKSIDKIRMSTSDQLINSSLAICLSLLDEKDESRRLFIETIRPQKKLTLSGVPIASLMNYLIFLHRNPENNEQYIRLKLHLLDLLEQAWLQRNQNDPQFNPFILNIAFKIANETFESSQSKFNISRKKFAWTKVNTSTTLL